MRKIALLAGAALLSACSATQQAAVQTAVANVATFTVADLQAAEADAVAHNDIVAAPCYPALITWVQSVQGANASTTVAGAFSAAQKARDVANGVQAGVPAAVKIACGPLLIDDQTFLIKLGVLTGTTLALPVPLP